MNVFLKEYVLSFVLAIKQVTFDSTRKLKKIKANSETSNT